MTLSIKDIHTLKKDLTSNPERGTAPIADHLATTLMTVDKIGELVSHEGVDDIMSLFDMGHGTLPDGEIIAKLKKHITDQVDNGTIQSYTKGKEIIDSLFRTIDNTLLELKQEMEKNDISTVKSLMAAFPEKVTDALDKAMKAQELNELKADILSIHKDYEQQKKGLFGFGTVSKEKQKILVNIEKALDTAISKDPDKNLKNIYESLRTTLIAERKKIKPGLLGGAKFRGIIDSVITTWDTRTQHPMEKDQHRILHKANK